MGRHTHAVRGQRKITSGSTPHKWPWLMLLALMAVYFAFGSLFAFHTNKFNAPDERMHFYNLQTVARTGHMPLFTEEKVAKEAHQPPLYYWVMTPAYWASYYLTGGVMTDEFKDSSTSDGGDMVATKQQVFWLRIVSLVISSSVIILTFWLVWQIFPIQQFSVQPWLALTAAAVVALNPQFIFMSGVVNNDVIANVASAALLCTLVRLLVQPNVTWRNSIWIGVVLAAGVLSKPHIWPITALVGIVFVVVVWRQRMDKCTSAIAKPSSAHWLNWLNWLKLRWLVIGLGPAVVATIWWFSRNVGLYGEPTIYSLMYDQWYAEQHKDFMSFSGLQQWAVTLFETFWARFGYFDLALNRVYYMVVKVVSAFALGGAFIWLWRSWKLLTRSERWVWFMLSLSVMSVFVIVFIFNLSFYQPQGRYLFPVIAVLAMLYAVGWIALLPRRWAGVVFALSVVGLIWMDVASLLVIAR